MNSARFFVHAVRLFLVLGIAAALGIPVDARAHGGDAGLIHSCVNSFLGTIRIIRPDGACFRVETPVDWPATASAGGFRIVDSQGLEVGTWTGTGFAFRKSEGLPGRLLGLPVTPAGFAAFSRVVPFVWTGPDCTGDRFLEVFGGEGFIFNINVAGSTGFFANLPFQTKLVSSMTVVPEFNGGCFNFDPPADRTVGVIETIDLSRFVPPFTVE